MSIARTPIDAYAARLRSLAQALEILSLRSRKMQAIVGFLIGALYSLWQANAFDFVDKSGRAVTPEKLHRLAREISKRSNRRPFTPSEKDWLGSYHFNNAVLRLDSIRLRLDKEGVSLNQKAKEALANLRNDANNLKHEAGGSIQHKREANMNAALSVAVEIIETLRRAPL